VRAILVGDVHLADKPPSVRTEDYAEQILGKLKFAVDKAIELKVDLLALAGDVFHVKTPSRTSHGLIVRVLEILAPAAKAGIEVGIVAGNHDMMHDRIESLETQPLGVLFKSGITPLFGNHPHLDVVGVPYLQDWVGDLKSWLGHSVITDQTLVITHAPIMPPGVSVPYEYIDAESWAEFQKTGNLYYGHIHEAHGVYRDPRVGLVFCNQGALSRGSLHESDQTRAPAITLFNSEEDYLGRFQRIEVPHRPAPEVFTLEPVIARERRLGQAEEFIRRIGTTTLDALSVEAVIAAIEGLDAERDVKSYAAELLREVDCR
jgi:predicted phosphodiesterase